MAYLKIHLISDLFLGYNEFSTEHEDIPDVDLVILNGNIGHVKRSMLYAETLCAKYPNIQFIYNPGETELYSQMGYQKSENEARHQFSQRQLINNYWPKNLHYNYGPMIIECKDGKKAEVCTLYGFPKIYEVNCPWESTTWYKYYAKGLVEEPSIQGKPFKPKNTSDVNHGIIHIPADIDWVNMMHESEWKIAQKYELTNNGLYKIYVTHINPYKDSRLANQECTAYNIHIDKKSLWLGADTEINGVQFLGGRLFSNPGRGQLQRSKIITID